VPVIFRSSVACPDLPADFWKAALPVTLPTSQRHPCTGLAQRSSKTLASSRQGHFLFIILFKRKNVSILIVLHPKGLLLANCPLSDVQNSIQCPVEDSDCYQQQQYSQSSSCWVLKLCSLVFFIYTINSFLSSVTKYHGGIPQMESNVGSSPSAN
jgi:hypothetical protein